MLGKIKFVVFCRSNIKFELKIFDIFLEKLCKIFGACARRQPFKMRVRNFEIMLILAHFSAKYIRFQILLEQPIFVVQKCLTYEKVIYF